MANKTEVPRHLSYRGVSIDIAFPSGYFTALVGGRYLKADTIDGIYRFIDQERNIRCSVGWAKMPTTGKIQAGVTKQRHALKQRKKPHENHRLPLC